MLELSVQKIPRNPPGTKIHKKNQTQTQTIHIFAGYTQSEVWKPVFVFLFWSHDH